MRKLRNLKEDDLRGKIVVVRCDFNVPYDTFNGIILDDTRIRASISTLKYLGRYAAKIIMITHLGRPSGASDTKFSTRGLLTCIQGYLGEQVDFIGAPWQDTPLNKKNTFDFGAKYLLAENIRFAMGELNNDVTLVQQLAKLGDIFISDAFSICHRCHASVVGLAKELPSYAGFNLEAEVDNLELLGVSPKRPFVMVVGGAKVSTKIGLLRSYLKICDFLCIGGAMANTFFVAKGQSVGLSLYEPDMVLLAKELLEQSRENQIILPLDLTGRISSNKELFLKDILVDKIPTDFAGLDIGNKSIELFGSVLGKANTVFWNGPLGKFEELEFAFSTSECARIIAGLTKEKGLISVLGGGDTVSAIADCGWQHSDFTYVSLGGGALLEYLQQSSLPGIEVLKN